MSKSKSLRIPSVLAIAMLTCVGGQAGPSALLLAGVTGVAITAITTTTAHAQCRIEGKMRNDIPKGSKCLEAQRTGCVQSMLSAQQYRNCIGVQKGARASGKTCIVRGQVRHDLSGSDCFEAQEVGCVKKYLSPAQYQACSDAVQR